MRITRSMLEAAVERLNKVTGQEYYVERAYGTYQLMKRVHPGVIRVSPFRGSASEICNAVITAAKVAEDMAERK